MKKLKILIILSCASTLLVAQCSKKSDVLQPFPDPCSMDRIQRPFPMSYASLRESDVMWSKRTWRIIDLREKMNLPMYYPTEPKVCLMSLFDILKCAILEGELTAFANPAYDDEFQSPMTREEVRKLLVSWDSTNLVEDVNEPDNMINVPVKNEITSQEIIQYRIKEDWFFDKQRSVMEVRIVGICPVTIKRTENGEVAGIKPLFWIYFPHARPYLARAAVFNRWNDAERLNYDELFQKRMFSGIIYKESNVYDRAIAEYKTGADAVLEAGYISEEIFNYENDFWHR